MEKIYVFDMDNTIIDRNTYAINSSTLKLLKKLKSKNYSLILATGRKYSDTISVLKEVYSFFDYGIFLNGAVCYQKNSLLFEESILKKDLSILYERSKGFNSRFILDGLNNEFEFAFFGDHKIYQITMLSSDEDELKSYIKGLNKFRIYLWHKDGAHYSYKHINKAYALKKILSAYNNYFLVAMGDGINDLEMLEMADISIVMENTKEPLLLKKATYVAYAVAKNKTYEFFEENKLI